MLRNLISYSKHCPPHFRRIVTRAPKSHRVVSSSDQGDCSTDGYWSNLHSEEHVHILLCIFSRPSGMFQDRLWTAFLQLLLFRLHSNECKHLLHKLIHSSGIRGYSEQVVDDFFFYFCCLCCTETHANICCIKFFILWAFGDIPRQVMDHFSSTFAVYAALRRV